MPDDISLDTIQDGLIRVERDGVLVSEHQREDKAISSGYRAKGLAPASEVRIVRPDLRVEGDVTCPEVAMEEPVEEEPEPEPTPTEGAFYATDFSEYPVGTRLQNTDPDPSGFRWLGGPYADIQESPDGSGHALAFYYGPTEPDGSSHWWSEQNFDLGRNARSLWLRFGLHVPSDYVHENADGSSDNNKLLSLWADSYQSEPLVIFQLWGDGDDSVVNVAVTSGELDGDSDLVRYPRVDGNRGILIGAGDRGRTIDIGVQVSLATPGQSDGLIRLWKDGTVLLDVPGLALYDEAGAHDYLRHGYLMGYDNGRFSRDTTFHVPYFEAHDSDPGWQQ